VNNKRAKHRGKRGLSQLRKTLLMPAWTIR
jgi:hypothetical protein